MKMGTGRPSRRKGREMLILRPLRGAITFIAIGLISMFAATTIILWLEDAGFLKMIPEDLQSVVFALAALAFPIGLGTTVVGCLILLIGLANVLLLRRKVLCPRCRNILLIFSPPIPEDFGKCPYCKRKVTPDILIVE